MGLITNEPEKSEDGGQGHPDEPVDERSMLKGEETLDLLDRSPVAVFLVDKDRYIWFLNRAAEDLSGVRHEEAIGGRPGEVVNCIHAWDSPHGCGFGDECEDCVVRQTVRDSFEKGTSHKQVEARLRTIMDEDEEDMYVLVSTTPVVVCGHNQVAVWVEDVTLLEKAREHYRELARQDPLTGLPNRRHFTNMLKRMIAEATRYGNSLSLLMLDLDDLKDINDGCGHNVGDATLKKFADVLHSTKRDADFLGRSGGDEFIVALPHTSATEAQNLGERIRRACEECDEPHEYPKWTTSIGVTEFRGDDDINDLQRRADQAMYRSKQQGKNIVTVWGDELTT